MSKVLDAVVVALLAAFVGLGAYVYLAVDFQNPELWLGAAERSVRWVAQAETAPVFALRATLLLGASRWLFSRMLWVSQPVAWFYRLFLAPAHVMSNDVR